MILLKIRITNNPIYFYFFPFFGHGNLNHLRAFDAENIFRKKLFISLWEFCIFVEYFHCRPWEIIQSITTEMSAPPPPLPLFPRWNFSHLRSASKALTLLLTKKNISQVTFEARQNEKLNHYEVQFNPKITTNSSRCAFGNFILNLSGSCHNYKKGLLFKKTWEKRQRIKLRGTKTQLPMLIISICCWTSVGRSTIRHAS